MAKAALQSAVLPLPQAVLTFVSAVPPTEICEFQIPTSPGAVPAMLTCRIIAPGDISPTVKRISWICATPTSPGLPTLMTGLGFWALAKLLPVPDMTDHASPTIRVPFGMIMVDLATYTP